MQDFISMSGSALRPDLRNWVETVLPETELFDGEQLVPCHRDYSPRNWLVSEARGQLQWALIDFERARLDLRYADFHRMWPDVWKERPARRAAFFDGYGSELSSDEERCLEITVLANCLATIPWASANGDPAYGQWALDMLEELREQW
jgi:thiamine kinase-like enzyme